MQCCSSPESHERVRCIGLSCWIRNQDRRGPKSHRECTPTRTAWSEAHESLTLNSIPVFYMARADVRVTKSRGLRTAEFFNYLHWTVRPDSKILHECAQWLVRFDAAWYTLTPKCRVSACTVPITVCSEEQVKCSVSSSDSN